MPRFDRNPVIPLDYPDPDVIRVGDTYYMASTTMHFMPGCEILRSYDLANWEHAAYVYDALDGTPGQRLRDGENIYGKGMWAPSLRHRVGADGVGRFYVCFVANDTHKTYLYTAQDVEGPWEKRHIEGFYHDCSLLFDDDGSAYLAYGNSEIYITQLKEDLSGPLEGGLHRLAVSDSGNPYLGYEGTHFYKMNGKYYLFCIHSRRDRWRRTECCFVADSLQGEFVGGDVLDDDRGYFGQGVAQGGIVDTPDGRWYAMLFQDSGAVGRLPILVPVTWQDDFPVFGERGKVPREFPLESTRSGYRYRPLVGSDDFRGDWKPCWQFNHEPDLALVRHDGERGRWEVTTGTLCGGPTEAVNTITQRMMFPSCAAEVTVDASAIQEGDYVGLCALQGDYCMVALTRREGKLRIVAIAKDAPELECAIVTRERVRFRLEVDFSDRKDVARLFYCQEEMAGDFLSVSSDIASAMVSSNDGQLGSADASLALGGHVWVQAGLEHKLHFGLDHFTGCRFGLAFYSTKQVGGKAVFMDFRYEK